MGLQGVAEAIAAVELVAIALTLARPGEDTLGLEGGDDGMDGAFGDSHLQRDLAERDILILREAHQNMGVIGEKGPTGGRGNFGHGRAMAAAADDSRELNNEVDFIIRDSIDEPATMANLELLMPSLFSPMVLAFGLGIVATLVRSDLKIPEQLYAALTIYLLFAIGLKGGAKLDGIGWAQFLPPVGAALALCIAIPLWSYWLLRKGGGFDRVDAAAIAAHYGSVSAVTFGAVIAFLDLMKVTHEAFMPALLAVMEVPAIVVALFLAGRQTTDGRAGGSDFGRVLRELLTGKGIVLLLGGMLIGLLSGKKGFEQVGPLFDAPFRGVLTIFLLEIGLVTGRHLRDLRQVGPFLAAFGIVMPVVHGAIGVGLGCWVGLGVGGSTVLGTLAASASYIAAPAAIRVALPKANPAFYLTSALAITFPFNVVIGIPIYFGFARWLAA